MPNVKCIQYLSEQPEANVQHAEGERRNVGRRVRTHAKVRSDPLDIVSAQENTRDGSVREGETDGRRERGKTEAWDRQRERHTERRGRDRQREERKANAACVALSYKGV